MKTIRVELECELVGITEPALFAVAYVLSFEDVPVEDGKQFSGADAMPNGAFRDPVIPRRRST